MTSDPYRRLVWAAAALLVIQLVHGFVPAETDAEGSVGFYAGILALLATIASLVGVARRRDWGRRLLAVTGASVAVGFLLYHALPITSPLTNPYFGEDGIGIAQWTPVILSMVIGAWAAWQSTAGWDELAAESPGTHRQLSAS